MPAAFLSAVEAVLADTGVNTPIDDFRSLCSVVIGTFFWGPHIRSNMLDAVDRTLLLCERTETGVAGMFSSFEDHADEDRVCFRREEEDLRCKFSASLA